jgi:acyl-CoA reductase-like NAD-dependent aldehyde dehydrogenase
MSIAQEQREGSAAGAERPETLTVENPATGQTVAEVPSLSREDVIGLVDRARAAQPAWEALGFRGRGALMRDMRRWLVQNRRRVIKTLSDENGKPYEVDLMLVL